MTDGGTVGGTGTLARDAGNGVPVGAPVVMLDADGVVTYASRAAPAVFGYDDPTEIVGRPGRDLWAHPDEAARAEEEFRSKGQWQGTFFARHRRGHAFPAVGRAWAIHIPPGNPQTFMVVSHAEGASDMRVLPGCFGVVTLPEIVLRGAIHDLNNIVGVAGGALPLLRPLVSEADADSREVFAMVEESCARATRLLKEMEGWLASWAGKDAGAKDVDVGLLAVGAARLATLGTRVAVEVEPSIPESLWKARCDEAGMFRVLVNLALNARQAMGGNGRLTIKAENVWDPKEGFFVRLSMSDTGPGMGQEALAHAFDLGFTTKAGGSGVGLAVARHIVARNGGRMEVESSPGRGTTFRLVLPVAETARDPTEPAS